MTKPSAIPQPHTLLQVSAGQRVRVKNVNTDAATRARLYSLGFTPGVEVQVFPEACQTGARRVRLRNSSLILGESMAESIVCECCLSEIELSALQKGDTAPLRACCSSAASHEKTRQQN